ncbi:carbohydrate porin [Methylobacterium sp. BTF04]|uniref:carbohydrate porin n=1 Tax=Methylobacterium sp. BTF04 TaxID=2708300 RepID=UPI0013D752EA|nr:carbohydrate porin [Methylobacterium sp. BTF04]NEU14132.1 carbohydrate porin [Methylobacterium sp. BTF04]
MAPADHVQPLRHFFVFGLAVALGIAPAWAQGSAEEAARIAAEGIAIGSPRGAGGDPQTSVAQSVTSSRPSANLDTSIQDQLGPYGDPFGFRAFLKTRGIVYSLTYIGETLGNVTGGTRRGAIYEGLLDLEVDVDLGALIGWRGAALHTNLFQIHGTGLSRGYVDNLLTISGIEALPSSRLYELWFEQKLFDDQFGIKIGQLAADTEFAVTQTGTVFVNSTFGWHNNMAVVIPSGGPIYPLAVPGVRAKYVPNANLSLQVGVFDGDPAGGTRRDTDADPQRRNRRGTNFRTDDPALVIAEAAYAYNIEKGSAGEAGTVTLGGWYHFGRFDSLRVDGSGIALADPASSGIARRFRGQGGLYGIIDQTIYREPDDPNDGASVFLRVSGSPADRSLIDLYLDAGIAYKGLLPGRSDDTVGIAFALSRLSGAARGFDTDTILATGSPGPRRSSEAVLEATYQAVLGPGVTVQPDVQYVFRPSGGIANPRDTNGARIRNAAIFGLRATIRY